MCLRIEMLVRYKIFIISVFLNKLKTQTNLRRIKREQECAYSGEAYWSGGLRLWGQQVITATSEQQLVDNSSAFSFRSFVFAKNFASQYDIQAFLVVQLETCKTETLKIVFLQRVYKLVLIIALLLFLTKRKEKINCGIVIIGFYCLLRP